MKRFLKIAVALALLVCLTACTITVNVNVDGVTPVNNSQNTPTPAPTQTPTPNQTEPTKQDEPTPSDDKKDDKPNKDDKKDDKKAPSELSSSSSKEDVVAKYIEVYNKTKADGTLRGSDAMSCTSVVLEGKENGMLKNLAGTVMKSNGHDMFLPPYSDDNPGNECHTTAADIKDYSYTDNGDGTATIKLTVNDTKNSRKFQDPAGNMFNVMEDVAAALADISLIKWSQGDANSNVVLTSGGNCEITYDKNTNLMTKAVYTLITVADVQHANVAMFKDKSAQATFEYVTTFPGV